MNNDVTGTIGIERTYALGNYQNIRVNVSFNNVPVKILTDPNTKGLVSAMLLSLAEKVYTDYVDMRKNMLNKSLDEIVAMLDETYKNSYDEFIKIFVNLE